MKCMQISKDGYQTTAFDDINYPVWGAQGFLSSRYGWMASLTQ